MGLRAKPRLQKLVAAYDMMHEASCLEVDYTKPHGPLFTMDHHGPIEAAPEGWMNSCDELHNWRKSLCYSLGRRISQCMRGDHAGLICGLMHASQPAGRYICEADLIRHWNQARGMCKCGRVLLLAHEWHDEPLHDEVCYVEGCSSYENHVACIQRQNTRIIHLASNCVGFVCQSCSSIAGYGSKAAWRRNHAVLGEADVASECSACDDE